MIQLFTVFIVIAAIFIITKYAISPKTRKIAGPGLQLSSNEAIRNIESRCAPQLELFLNTISSTYEIYNVDLKTEEFLKLVFSDSPYSMHENYNTWMMTTTLPADIRHYAKYVRRRIKSKISGLGRTSTPKTKKRIHRPSFQNQREVILKKHSARITKFLEITYRRFSKIDEYGDADENAFGEEFVRLIKKLSSIELNLQSELSSFIQSGGDISYRASYPITFDLFVSLKEQFNDYCVRQKSYRTDINPNTISTMSGVDFEQFLVGLLKQSGATEISCTPATGDQGADVLFTAMNTRVAIQAKCYTGSVGNKAVQEIYAAREYYKCDEAWVVTNSIFTLSARTLARQLGVILIDGVGLNTFSSLFQERFKDQTKSTTAA